MERRSGNITTNDSKTPNKPDEGSKEFLEWKIQRREHMQNEQIDELSAVVVEQRKEIDDQKEKIKSQNTQLAMLRAELKAHRYKCETVQKKYENAEDLYNKCKNKYAALEDKLLEVEESSDSQIAMLKEQHDKELAKQKCVYVAKMTTAEDQHSRAAAEWKSQLQKMTQKCQDKEESANRTIQEKEDQINELLIANQERHTQVEQTNEEENKDTKVTLSIAQQNSRAQMFRLQDMIEEYRGKMSEHANEIATKTREIAKLEKQNEAQAKTISNRDQDISINLKDKKRLQKQLQDEETKSAMMEVKLRYAAEAIGGLEEELGELKALQAKMTKQLRMAEVKSEEGQEKIQILQHQLQVFQPMLRAEEEKCRALEHHNRDFLAGLEGCRNVLEDPGTLRKKVAALISHYLQENTKVRVDRDAENVNTQLVGLIKEQLKRTDRIVSQHKKEKEQFTAAMNNARIRTDNENMKCIAYINDQRMQNGKKEERLRDSSV